jgi:hypothetical protein
MAIGTWRAASAVMRVYAAAFEEGTSSAPRPGNAWAVAASNNAAGRVVIASSAAITMAE